MGKVRKLRQKYHLSKVEEAKSGKVEVQPIGEKSRNEELKRIPATTAAENIFAGLDITYDTLTKSLPVDFDARSVVSTKSRKEMKLEEQHLKKKVKMKLRRERFLQKLDVTQQAMRAAKRKKKKKGSVNGEKNPLLEALPSLASLINEKGKKKKDNEKKDLKSKGILKMRKRVKQQTADAKLMKKILRDEKFKANPGQTITEYLKRKVAMER